MGVFLLGDIAYRYELGRMV